MTLTAADRALGQAVLGMFAKLAAGVAVIAYCMTFAHSL